LEIYPALVKQAARKLAPNGILVLELGYNGAQYVGSLLSAPQWTDLRVTRDLARIERVISARLSA
jgi:release factor glutamine methyltransferase